MYVNHYCSSSLCCYSVSDCFSLQMHAYEGLQWFQSLIPSVTDITFKTLALLTDVFPKYQRTAVSWEVFNIPHYIAPSTRQAEVAVPFNMCRKAIEDLFEVKNKFNIHVNCVTEV